MNIGIWGKTSHIAKGLAERFDKPILFGRGDYDHLGNLDVIINCIGVGTNPKDSTEYFTITEKFDNLAINYLKKHPSCLYISLSSGVVHNPTESDYGAVRLYTEAKHRAFKDLKIVDLRLYAYFSRFYDPQDDYFMVDVMEAVLNNKKLITTSRNFLRDFVHPDDLFSIIKLVIKKKVNLAVDVYSVNPTTKQEILNYFVKEHKLKVKLDDKPIKGATGEKAIYYPTNREAEKLGYKPKYTSFEAIKKEAEWLIKRGN